MYPTELLLAQQYAHSHPYAAYPPLYLWPSPPQPVGTHMHAGHDGSAQLGFNMQQHAPGGLTNKNEQQMETHQQFSPQRPPLKEQLAAVAEPAGEQRQDQLTAATSPFQPNIEANV